MLFFSCFCFVFGNGAFYITLTVLGLTIVDQAGFISQRDMSASPVLGLKACTTMSCFKHLLYGVKFKTCLPSSSLLTRKNITAFRLQLFLNLFLLAFNVRMQAECQKLWCMALIPTCQRQRQFQDSLLYITSSRLARATQ